MPRFYGRFNRENDDRMDTHGLPEHKEERPLPRVEK